MKQCAVLLKKEDREEAFWAKIHDLDQEEIASIVFMHFSNRRKVAVPALQYHLDWLKRVL